jgi:hypothetical protein
MRTRLASVVLVAATGCFQVEPLPDCAEQSGPYLQHHVCMPAAGPPITMPVAPRKLVAGDFDNENIDNDFAVLLDQGFIQVYATSGQQTQLAAELTAPSRVESLIAVRYFALGQTGDDLIGVIRGDGKLPGTVFAFHNGGDLFAGKVVEQFLAISFLLQPCVAPNSLVAIEFPGVPFAVGLAVACETAAGAATDVIDGMVVYNPAVYDEMTPEQPFEQHARFGLPIPEQAEVHAATVAQLDGLGFPDVALASRTGEGEDETIVVYPVIDDPMTMMPDVEPTVVPLANGRVGALQVADLDDDGDSDLVAIHPLSGGVSVVRQNRSEPLEFAEAAFFAVGSEIRDIVIGDFTGDGGVDIAVAQVVDDTGYNAISMFVRKPDLLAGTIDYALAPVAYLKGEIVDLEPIDHDGDGRTDIAAVVKVGSAGEVYVFLNRSPAG